MARLRTAGWIDLLGARARRRVAQFGRLVAGPDLHLTLVIARAANRARMHRAGIAAGHSFSRTER